MEGGSHRARGQTRGCANKCSDAAVTLLHTYVRQRLPAARRKKPEMKNNLSRIDTKKDGKIKLFYPSTKVETVIFPQFSTFYKQGFLFFSPSFLAAGGRSDENGVVINWESKVVLDFHSRSLLHPDKGKTPPPPAQLVQYLGNFN